MDSLLSAFFSAQVGRLQLAVAARLARTDPNSPVNPDVGSSVTKLVDAAQQNTQPPQTLQPSQAPISILVAVARISDSDIPD